MKIAILSRALMSTVTATAMLATTSLVALAPVAQAESAHKTQDKRAAEIPHCTKKLGTIAIVEPDNNWWRELELGSPEAIIKVFVLKSGCFGLVDRSKGLASRNIERALADSGELQQKSNIGKKQVKVADYFLVPDLVGKNNNAGGSNVGGLLGGIFGGSVGAAIGGAVQFKKKDASVTLTVVNARTTEQERIVEGYAKKSDIGFGGALGGIGGGAFGAAGGSSYENTQVGQVIVLAFLDAYTKLVGELGGLPADASAAAPKAQ